MDLRCRTREAHRCSRPNLSRREDGLGPRVRRPHGVIRRAAVNDDHDRYRHLPTN